MKRYSINQTILLLFLSDKLIHKEYISSNVILFPSFGLFYMYLLSLELYDFMLLKTGHKFTAIFIPQSVVSKSKCLVKFVSWFSLHFSSNWVLYQGIVCLRRTVSFMTGCHGSLVLVSVVIKNNWDSGSSVALKIRIPKLKKDVYQLAHFLQMVTRLMNTNPVGSVTMVYCYQTIYVDAMMDIQDPVAKVCLFIIQPYMKRTYYICTFFFLQYYAQMHN